MLSVVGFFCCFCFFYWLGQLVVRVMGISPLFILWLAFGPNLYTSCALFCAFLHAL